MSTWRGHRRLSFLLCFLWMWAGSTVSPASAHAEPGTAEEAPPEVQEAAPVEPEPGAALVLPDPEPIDATEVAPLGEEPWYYRTREPTSGAGVPVTLGAMYATGGADDPTWGFKLDAFLSAFFELGQGEWRWALWPELGYSLGIDGAATSHVGVVGTGVALQNEYLSFGVVPRALVGTAGGAFAYGVEGALSFRGAYDYPVGVSLGVRWLHSEETRLIPFAGATLDVARLLLDLDEVL